MELVSRSQSEWHWVNEYEDLVHSYEHLKELSVQLAASGTLKALRVSNCRLREDGANALLPGDWCSEVLRRTMNGCSAARAFGGAPAGRQAVQSSAGQAGGLLGVLESLDVLGNRLGSQVADRLVHFLQKSSLRSLCGFGITVAADAAELTLSNRNMDPSNIRLLASELSACPMLRSVDLSSNPIRGSQCPEGHSLRFETCNVSESGSICSLCMAPGAPHGCEECALRHHQGYRLCQLCFSRGREEGARQIEALFSALTCEKVHVAEVKLRACGLGSWAVSTICEKLGAGRASALARVDLASNNFEPDAVDASLRLVRGMGVQVDVSGCAV